jgi:hypothetical protein
LYRQKHFALLSNLQFIVYKRSGCLYSILHDSGISYWSNYPDWIINMDLEFFVILPLWSSVPTRTMPFFKTTVGFSHLQFKKYIFIKIPILNKICFLKGLSSLLNYFAILSLNNVITYFCKFCLYKTTRRNRDKPPFCETKFLLRRDWRTNWKYIQCWLELVKNFFLK